MAIVQTPSYFTDLLEWARKQTLDGLIASMRTGGITAEDAARIKQETINAIRRAGGSEADVEAYKLEADRLVESMGGTAQEQAAQQTQQIETLARWAVIALVVIGVVLVLGQVRR